MRRLCSAVALIALIAISSGCYHYHLRASGNRANSSYFRKTLDPSSEGRRSNYVVPPAADCKANGLYEVGITSPWKYAAGRVFSFGLWSRVKVEWLCANEPPVIGPTGLGPDPAAASPPKVARQPKPSPDGFTKRTVHALLWGALQQNLLPPPSATTKTPANCQSMRQVKLPMNYGYALITVLSAGIWSPMQVAWKCNEEPTSAPTNQALTSPTATRRLSPQLFPRLSPQLGKGPATAAKEEKHVYR
ncbi:MAG TPA: hypothetical protein VJ464_08550 [Blastocatellia bacterium]|nr:hypothetical protein [Blastocatellia bacterium]